MAKLFKNKNGDYIFSWIQNYSAPKLFDMEAHALDEPFTMEKLHGAVFSTSINSVAGAESIPLRHGPSAKFSLIRVQSHFKNKKYFFNSQIGSY